MARKTSARSRYSSTAADSDMGKAVTDSAQKIWLAGLGAYERAKAEGPKMFDTLVEQGKGLRDKAREAADQALKSVREGASGAGQRFDKLEQVFEDRVSKSLNRLGVLTRGEVKDLSNQVRRLTDDVRSLMKKQAGAGSKAKRSGAAKAGAAKRKAKRAASSVKRSAAQRTRKRAGKS
jgi:poly(hydroxyalkanoate) granule-associated protein